MSLVLDAEHEIESDAAPASPAAGRPACPCWRCGGRWHTPCRVRERRPCTVCKARPATGRGTRCNACRATVPRWKPPPAPPRPCWVCGDRTVVGKSAHLCAACQRAACPKCGGVGEHRYSHPPPRHRRGLVSDADVERELLVNYRHAVCLALTICGSNDADDAVQSAALGVWRLRDYLDPFPGIGFYFMKAVRRHAIAAAQGTLARPLLMDPVILEAVEAQRRLHAFGRRLPPKLLRYIEAR